MAPNSGATELEIRAGLTGSTSLQSILPPSPRRDVSGAVGPARFAANWLDSIVLGIDADALYVATVSGP